MGYCEKRCRKPFRCESSFGQTRYFFALVRLDLNEMRW